MSENTQIVKSDPGSGAVAQYQAPLTVEELVGRVSLVREVKAKVMKDGEHYGKIPGTGEKPTLLQPGAQTLGMTFRLHPEYEVSISEMDRDHREYQSKCKLYNSAGGFEGECSATCSTMETRYRYRKAMQKCPQCGTEAIIKGKKEYGGGWLCFKKTGGCGAKFSDGDTKIENQEMGRVEHDNPADYWNTALKMSQKRAYVGAIIGATGGSDLFTQDVEDLTDAPVAPVKPRTVSRVPDSETVEVPDPVPVATRTDKAQLKKLLEWAMVVEEIDEDQFKKAISWARGAPRVKVRDAIDRWTKKQKEYSDAAQADKSEIEGHTATLAKDMGLGTDSKRSSNPEPETAPDVQDGTPVRASKGLLDLLHSEIDKTKGMNGQLLADFVKDEIDLTISPDANIRFALSRLTTEQAEALIHALAFSPDDEKEELEPA